MSKWIEDKDEKWIITVADADACKHEMNEICCNEDSNRYGMWATKNTCSDCGLFEKEDGKWRDGEGKKHFHREIKTGKVECRAMEALNREAFTLAYEDMAITIPLTEAQKLIQKVRKNK